MSTNGLGSKTTPHWGDDRRQALSRPDGSPTGILLVGFALLLAAFSAVNVVGGLPSVRTGVDAVLLQMLLEAGAAALAVMVALLCIVRWRLVGEAAAIWAGVALLVLGVVTMALSGLLPLVYDPAVDTVVWLRPASRIITMAFLGMAVASPPVDGRLRFGGLLLLAATLTALLAIAFDAAPGVAQHVAGAADSHRGIPDSGYGPPLLIVAWTALTVAFVVRGHRESRPLLSWLGLMVAGLGLAELTRILAAEDAALWSAGAHLLRLAALGIGVAGATLELQRAFSHQSRDLMNSVVATAAAEARLRAGRQEAEERAHEARNALAAIEGASLTLERYRDYLDADTRGSLVSAVAAEVARLQRLVSAERTLDDRTVFRVAETLAPVITGARAQGTTVVVDICETLTAFGRWADTAEAVQNLIENARRYAPDSPVVITAHRDDHQVLIRVEDRGPGVAPEHRDVIFRRGGRGTAGDAPAGSGLGLYVSRQLMRDQHGDLWLEDRPGGGAAFVTALPAEPDESHDSVVTGSDAHRRVGRQGGGAAPDQGHEALEILDDDRLPSDLGQARGRTVR